MPGDVRQHTFEFYDMAASLTVKVTGASPSVTTASLLPLAGGAGGEIERTLVDGKAEFEVVYPGTYSLWAGTGADASPTQSVTLAPGQKGSEEVVF
jgi:hypothetical protein